MSLKEINIYQTLNTNEIKTQTSLKESTNIQVLFCQGKRYYIHLSHVSNKLFGGFNCFEVILNNQRQNCPEV